MMAMTMSYSVKNSTLLNGVYVDDSVNAFLKVLKEIAGWR